MGKADLTQRKPTLNISGMIEGILKKPSSVLNHIYNEEDGFRLLDMTAGIKNALLRDAPDEKTVCLVSEDKGFVMAAILAALSGGPDLILPHALTPQVVSNACEAKGTGTVLSETGIAQYENLNLTVPEKKIAGKKNTAISRNPEEPFLWLYSGGSTGKPIIWPKTPANLFGEAFFLKDYFGINSSDVFLSSVSPRHIYGLLFSVLLPFAAGARVAAECPVFPAEIIKSASSSGANVYIGAPLHYKALAAGSGRLGNVRVAFSSGGFLDKAHSLAFSRANGVPVEEVYGSTETGGIAHRSRMRDEARFKAFPSVGFKIEEERLLVKSAFISPALALDDEGYFLTGDRAVKSGDGFELLGRVDNVVKVGGNRVELDAVENKIRAIKGIKDVYIFQVTARQGRDSEIAAAVVSDRDAGELKRIFRKILGPAEVPRHILKVGVIPVTPAGKKDRQALLNILQR